MNLIQTNLIQIKFDDKSTSDLDDEINKTNLIFCRAFRIYLTSDEFKKKMQETGRLNQGTSAGKPKQNGEVYQSFIARENV